MNRFQRIALTAFVCLEVLIFVGALVRATGSGLGVPDWPKCYGRYFPPSSAADIDFTKLDMVKFKAAAVRHGRDPDTITEANLRAEFDPVATWIEYINRLTSLPLGISVLVLLIAAFRKRQRVVLVSSIAAFVLLILNGWIGATVVLSALQPVRISLHMGLAILMLFVLVFTAWRGRDDPWRFDTSHPARKLAAALLVLVLIEGFMGSQVRQLTDALARTHAGHPRIEWVGELEQSWVYLLHRSFSWLIVGTAMLFYRQALRTTWLERSIVGLVFAQMLLGVVLSQVGVLAIAQILHIGLSSLLVSALGLWLLASRRKMAVAC